MARQAISKSVRFEVFKRDGFTCQYCGQQAPEVILEIDHIQPVSKGGDGDIMNLVTSCKACNAGKGSRELSDDAILKKQQKQLEELNDRRLQLEMLLEWKEGLSALQSDETDALVQRIRDIACIELTDAGQKDLRDWIRKFSFSEVVEAHVSGLT